MRGMLLQEQGKLSESEPYRREALEKSRRVLGEEHPDTVLAIKNMGFLLQEEGKLSEAEPYFREVLEKQRRVLGEEHPFTLVSTVNMGYLLQAEGKLAEAEPYYREGLEKCRRVLGQEHPETLISIIGMGHLLQAQGKHAEAAELLVPAEGAIRNAFIGLDATRLALFLRILGEARTGLGQFAAAEANLTEANEIFLHTLGPSDKGTRNCMQAIVALYTGWAAARPGHGYKSKAAEWERKLDALSKPTSTPSTNQ